MPIRCKRGTAGLPRGLFIFWKLAVSDEPPQVHAHLTCGPSIHIWVIRNFHRR